MAEPSARRVSLAALQTWRSKIGFADSVIAGLLSKAGLAARDRAFAMELFYGVLRNLTLLDFWIDLLRHSATSLDLRDILRLGLYQIFFLKTDEHAAVYQTVELTPKRTRGLIR